MWLKHVAVNLPPTLFSDCRKHKKWLSPSNAAEIICLALEMCAMEMLMLFSSASGSGGCGGRTPQGVRAIRGLLLWVFAPADDDQWVHHVAEGLAHLEALLIQHEAVGEHPADRRSHPAHEEDGRQRKPGTALRGFCVQLGGHLARTHQMDNSVNQSKTTKHNDT